MAVRFGDILSVIYLMSLLQVGRAVHTETTSTSNSVCYADNTDRMALSCASGSVIAITQIWFGAKQLSTGCPPEFANDTSPSCCSDNMVDDCIYRFDHANFPNHHVDCNGKQACEANVQRDFSSKGSCDATLYPAFTQFEYIDYVCVDAASMNSICAAPVSFNVTAQSIYITSDGFPNAMATTSTSPCTCSVQADNTTLQVVTIQRKFTGNTNVTCNQSLTLLDSVQDPITMWTCDNNTYVSETFDVGSDYVILSLDNDMITPSGNFWVEIISSDSTSTLMVDCPAFIPTTTTSTTMSTTTSTTTTTTATTSTTTAASTTTTITPSTTTSSTPTTTSTTPTTTTTTTTTPTIPTTNISSTTPEAHTVSEDKNSYLIPFIICAVLALLLVIAVVILIYCLCRKKQPSSTEESDPEKKGILHNSDDKKENSSMHDSAEFGETHATDIVEVSAAPPATVAPMLIDEKLRKSEQDQATSKSKDVVDEPVATSDKSINTDHVVITFDEKSIQVVADTSEQGENAFVSTETKETNTPTPLSMVHTSVQTKKIRTKNKKTEIASMDENINESAKTEREPEFHKAGEISDNFQEVAAVTRVDEGQLQKIETDLSEPANGDFSVPLPPASAPTARKRLKKERSTTKRKKLIRNNYVEPAPEPVTTHLDEENENVETPKSNKSSQEPKTDEMKRNANEANDVDDSHASNQTTPRTLGADETKTDAVAGVSDYKRLQKRLMSAFYKPEREARRIERSFSDLKRLKGRSRKKTAKKDKEEKHPTDSGIETNSHNSSDTAEKAFA